MDGQLPFGRRKDMSIGSIKRISIAIALLLMQAGFAAAADEELGSISFPNSGDSAAQAAFLRGVAALHSFEFDPARIAFEEAQQIDPDFALAYWGQAMSDNHPLWAQQDVEAATAALTRLAPSVEGRLAKAPTEKEKAWLNAVEALYYSHEDKLERDIAYSEYMARMHERWPDDHEVSVFYALSLLGTVRRGDQGFRRQALAASIAQEVYAENENHPGAAHFIIHSFDDPDHAILALPAATVYAGIAPAAAHALHMPSHIFVQLGMWQEVVNSNIEAYDAAVAMNKKYGLAEGREDFHTLAWLAYANLMLGQFDRARDNLALAKAAVDRNPDNDRILDGYLLMRGRHMIETGEWEDEPLEPVETVAGSSAHWVSVVGMSAAYRDDQKTAQAAIERLDVLQKKAMSESEAYDAKQIAILGKEVAAVASYKSGDMDKAIATAREAADMEIRDMSAPSGPPMPMKPAIELYADILLAAGRSAEALLAYERSAQWIPQRTPSLLGMSQAANAVGENETAAEMITKVKAMPGVHPAIR
jgi:tetratricopeptide (TPR) repeat protein